MDSGKNYTLGRGEIYFAQINAATGLLGGERYLGNTTEFSLNFESEELDHFSSERGIKELDKSVVMQITRGGSLTTDNISAANVALAFFGSAEALTFAAATVASEPVGVVGLGVELGMFYQLGPTTANPSGARKIVYPGTGATAFSLKKGAVELVSGVDYLLDANLGRIEILETSVTVLEGDELTASYSTEASTRTRIISGSASIEGALRFIAYPATGDPIDYYMPKVSLSPNGDYALKGDDWQEIPLSVKVLKPADGEALYGDGRSITTP